MGRSSINALRLHASFCEVPTADLQSLQPGCHHDPVAFESLVGQSFMSPKKFFMPSNQLLCFGECLVPVMLA